MLPTNPTTSIIAKNLCKLDIQVATNTSTTIKDLTKKGREKQPPSQSKAGIYMVPCADCDQFYVGETARTLKKRIYEHKRALQLDNHLNALVGHRNTHNHNFDLQKANMVKYMHKSNKRRCIEAALISTCNTIR